MRGSASWDTAAAFPRRLSRTSLPAGHGFPGTTPASRAGGLCTPGLGSTTRTGSVP